MPIYEIQADTQEFGVMNYITFAENETQALGMVVQTLRLSSDEPDGDPDYVGLNRIDGFIEHEPNTVLTSEVFGLPRLATAPPPPVFIPWGTVSSSPEP